VANSFGLQGLQLYSDEKASMTDLSAYLVGRKPGNWPAATIAATDMLFAATRKDGETLDGLEFEHCTFANVSFKEVTLNQCRFTDCAFLNCYFRKCEMVATAFVGCKFVSCDLPKVTIQSCDFKYSHFDQCSIPFAEMEHSLPREPNLREELARGLSISSDALGLDADGRRYRLAAIQAREEHLRAAFLSDSDWYHRHYSGLRKFQAFMQFVASRANGLIWGHGEKWFVLVRNLVVLAFAVFPVALWFARDGLLQSSGPFSVWDLIWLSVTTIVPVDGVTTAVATTSFSRAILTIEAFVGVVGAGLLVTQLVHRMLRR
jgi:hypothetical protein